MQIAQKLYEGIELGEEGAIGLITYMRTDSVRISDDARDAAKNILLIILARNIIQKSLMTIIRARKRTFRMHMRLFAPLTLKEHLKVLKSI